VVAVVTVSCVVGSTSEQPHMLLVPPTTPVLPLLLPTPPLALALALALVRMLLRGTTMAGEQFEREVVIPGQTRCAPHAVTLGPRTVCCGTKRALPHQCMA